MENCGRFPQKAAGGHQNGGVDRRFRIARKPFHALVQAAWEEWSRLYGLIIETPAATAAGVLAKLQLYVAEADPFDSEPSGTITSPEDLDVDSRLFAFALEDLKRLGGAA